MLEALCSLMMSQDEVNHDLFHMYPLDLKLEALEYFWDNVAYKLPFEFYSNDKYLLSYILTYLPFKSAIHFNQYSKGIMFTRPYGNQAVKVDFNLNYLKQYYIEYVTNYHKSLNPDEILKS